MKILVIDIETTALYASKGNIVEIGGVELELETGKLGFSFNFIINEGKFDERAWIFQNSSLTKEAVKKGHKLEDIRAELQSYFDNYQYIVAYNQSFDFGWLQSRNFKLKYTCLDPMLIATDLLQIEHEYYGHKYPKVEECLDYFEIDESEPHRASEDAKLEARIIHELYKRNLYKIGVEAQ